MKYLLTFALQYISLQYYSFVFVAVLFLYIGVCLFSMTFVSDIELCLNDLSNAITIADGNFSIKKRIEIKEKFFDAISFHADAKQLSYFAVQLFRKLL